MEPNATQAHSIRLATIEDVAAIVEIERATFSKPWSDRSFRDMIGAPAAIVLVAVSTSAGVQGFAAAYVAADVAELANIAVAKPGRGLGIGRAVLRDVIRRVEERGATTLFLDVRASNVAAFTLYRSEGFREIARRKDYYSHPVEDAIVMRRAIP